MYFLQVSCGPKALREMYSLYERVPYCSCCRFVSRLELETRSVFAGFAHVSLSRKVELMCLEIQ